MPWSTGVLDIHVSRSRDKSKIINSFELKILTERVDGMGLSAYFPNQGGYISFSVAFKPYSAKKWSTTAMTYGQFLSGLFEHQPLNQIFSFLNGCCPNDSVVYLGCSPSGSSPNVRGSPYGCSLFKV